MKNNNLDAYTVHPASRAAVAQILGRRVRYFRAQLGISQLELAGRAQTDRSYVSRVERGLLLPRLATLVKFAASLNVSVSELVRGVPVSDLNCPLSHAPSNGPNQTRS